MGIFKKDSHYCRTPRGRRNGQRWKCPKCGAGYIYRLTEHLDRQGRTRKTGGWQQIFDGKTL